MKSFREQAIGAMSSEKPLRELVRVIDRHMDSKTEDTDRQAQHECDQDWSPKYRAVYRYLEITKPTWARCLDEGLPPTDKSLAFRHVRAFYEAMLPGEGEALVEDAALRARRGDPLDESSAARVVDFVDDFRTVMARPFDVAAVNGLIIGIRDRPAAERKQSLLASLDAIPRASAHLNEIQAGATLLYELHTISEKSSDNELAKEARDRLLALHPDGKIGEAFKAVERVWFTWEKRNFRLVWHDGAASRRTVGRWRDSLDDNLARIRSATAAFDDPEFSSFFVHQLLPREAANDITYCAIRHAAERGDPKAFSKRVDREAEADKSAVFLPTRNRSLGFALWASGEREEGESLIDRTIAEGSLHERGTAFATKSVAATSVARDRISAADLKNAKTWIDSAIDVFMDAGNEPCVRDAQKRLAMLNKWEPNGG